MQTILNEPDATELMLVNLPEELPTFETQDTLDWLGRELLVSRTTVVTNRILPILEWDGERLPTGPAGDAARLQLDLQSEQQRWIAELAPDRRLPFLFGTMTASEVAALLSERVEAWP
jgi:hypothetical protein